MNDCQVAREKYSKINDGFFDFTSLLSQTLAESLHTKVGMIAMIVATLMMKITLTSLAHPLFTFAAATLATHFIIQLTEDFPYILTFRAIQEKVLQNYNSRGHYFISTLALTVTLGLFSPSMAAVSAGGMGIINGCMIASEKKFPSIIT